MAKNKTAETGKSVTEFLNNVQNEIKRRDSFILIEIIKSLTGYEPKMWGPSIIGFGKYHYKYASGHEGDAPLAGFSPRKESLVIYMAPEFKAREELLPKLGKQTNSKSCIYVKKLEDIDIEVLKKIIKNSMDAALKLYPT
jgi:hypothetical protein